jgi:hypothetical protein
MNSNLNELTLTEQAENDIKTAFDSVNLVNQLVSEGTHSTETDNRVWANWKHLEIVMSRENVIEYFANNVDNEEIVSKKTAIEQAINDGSAFAPNNTMN